MARDGKMAKAQLNEKNESKKKSCCDNSKGSAIRGNRQLLQGLTYGLIPHIGCIAFIISSVLGVTLLTQFFKPLLMNQYFFYALIAISLALATISSVFYLRKNGFLSSAGMKKKWKYLSVMYGSTIGVNLLLFMVIFPLLANVSFAQPSHTGYLANYSTGGNSGLSSLSLKVDIPCYGHAPLISGELKSVDGVTEVRFTFPNIFDVKYDSTKTSKEKILSLEVFKTYKATVLDEPSVQQNNQPTSTGGDSCGGSCNGSCGCGK